MASTSPREATDVKAAPASTIKTVSKTAPKSAPVNPWMQAAKFLGSIQMALILGTVFTLAMIIGTCLESWYSDKIGQELIYHTWWFTGLLGLLAVCIFCAAMKKWPWKKHQTGFLITHVGLLTLLAGGVLNSFLGVDAVMRLVDSKMASEQLGVPQKSSQIQMSNHTMMTVERHAPIPMASLHGRPSRSRSSPAPCPGVPNSGSRSPCPASSVRCHSSPIPSRARSTSPRMKMCVSKCLPTCPTAG
ncbi:MAG: hypothetical protein QM703_20395 [Gemmatales bacterium]